MVAFSDALGLLTRSGIYEVIVPFILVYAVVYAVMNRTELVKGKELQSIISLAIAIGVVVSPTARVFIATLVPYFTGFGMVLFMLAFVLLMGGMKTEEIFRIVKFEEWRWLLILAIAIVLLFVVMASAFPDVSSANIERIAQEENKSVAEKVEELSAGERAVFFLSLPQVLGLIVLFFIFAISAYVIAA